MICVASPPRPLPTHVDLMIVGAGPSGMAAAIEASQAGLSVLVADEGMVPGGQVYRNVDGAAADLSSALGRDFSKGRLLTARFRASPAVYAPRSTVFMIERNGERFEVGLTMGEAAHMVEARSVLIATGAQERPFPIPGWTLPGVMTAGAAQTLLKASGIVPSGPVVLAGNGPLLLLLAVQFLRLGVPISALLETTPPGNLVSSLPHLPGFLFSPYAWKGMASCSRRCGDARSPSASGTWQRRAWPARTDPFPPSRQESAHRGLDTAASPGRGATGQSRDVGGCGTRVECQPPGLRAHLDRGSRNRNSIAVHCRRQRRDRGADAAEARGVIAAGAIVQRLHGQSADLPSRVDAARLALRTHLNGRAFLDRLYRPADVFRQPADNVVVCRCEEVTAGTIRRLASQGATGPNQIKAFCRAGMGPCQGRSCGLTVTEIIAETRGMTPDDVGYMRVRSP